jgi:S1-C subfamily serine protease
VRTSTGRGTGFYIGDGEFITAAHVVGFDLSVTLESPSFILEAEVVGIEVDPDVALLRVADIGRLGDLESIRWGSVNDLPVGRRIGVGGYPREVEDSPSLTSGLVSKVLSDPDLGFGKWIQTDAAMNVGNSGGPVFDECGLVVGIVIKGPPKAFDLTGIGWVLSEETVREAIPRLIRKGPALAQYRPPTATPTAAATQRPVLRAFCYLNSGETTVPGGECLSRMQSGYPRRAARLAIASWDNNQTHTYSIDGVTVTNTVRALATKSLGVHSVRVYDPPGGNYEGWSEPLTITLIDSTVAD